MAIILIEEVLGGLEEVKESLEQAWSTLGSFAQPPVSALSPLPLQRKNG